MIEENKQYQLTCLLSPLLEQKEIEEISQKIEKWIKEKGGSLLGERNYYTFKKNLAYPLKKYREAFYLNFGFLLAGQYINQLGQKLNLEKDILRHFVINNPRPKAKPETIDKKIADKIEPLIAREVPLKDIKAESEETTQKRVSPNREKVEIEKLDKKLDEILNE